jgi:hypothetical protein
MAENIVLAQILSGIAALRLKKDIDTVIKEAKTRKCELVAEAARITLEENNALAKGNTEAMILANMEAFDYRFVAKKDLAMAKKWFNAPKVRKNQKDSVSVSAYYYWRIWNDASCPRYKGNAIMEKATGKSASSSSATVKDESEEEESEEEESEEKGSDEEEMTAAMAGTRVE